MGQEIVVQAQMAVRTVVGAMMAPGAAKSSGDRARQYRELAAFLSATARDLEILAACEDGISVLEAGDRARAVQLALRRGV